jgi:enamine deaminase RidA (YjgF/YER057c/UK114 family)
MVSLSTLMAASAALLGVLAAPDNQTGSNPVYTSSPGYGQNLTDTRLYSQAVRIGRYVSLAGQGGWDINGNLPSNFTTQVENAFTNIDTALKVAGSQGLPDVTSIRVYIPETGAAFQANTLEEIRVRGLRMPGQLPTSTSIGVAALAISGMQIEIETEAWIQ